MSGDRQMVMASTFRAWWQSLAEQEPEVIAPGNTFSAGRLQTFLVEIGQRNGAVVARERGDQASRSAPELNPTFDWNGEIEVGLDAPIADLVRATGISEQEPLA